MTEKVLDMPSENGTIAKTESVYSFSVEHITAREVALFNKHRMPSNENTVIQLEIMNLYLDSAPDGAEPEKYVQPFFKMRNAFVAALALNKAEAVGYRFDVEKLTHADLSLIMLYARANNVDKLAPLLDKYLTGKPKGVGELADLPHSIFDALSQKLLDAIGDLSKN